MTKAGQPVTHMRSTNSKPQPSNQFSTYKIKPRPTFVLVWEAFYLHIRHNRLEKTSSTSVSCDFKTRIRKHALFNTPTVPLQLSQTGVPNILFVYLPVTWPLTDIRELQTCKFVVKLLTTSDLSGSKSRKYFDWQKSFWMPALTD